MPRRRALQIAVGAFAGVAFPGLTRSARAARPSSRRISCGPGKEPCSKNGLEVCMPAGGTCCWFSPEDSGYQPDGIVVGCGRGYRCGTARGQRCICNGIEKPNGSCAPCPGLGAHCVNKCCKGRRGKRAAEVCYRGQCRPACPTKLVKCGDNCCKRGQVCCRSAQGNDSCCEAGDKCCGQTCCPKGRACCTGSSLSPHCCASGEVCAPKPGAAAIQGDRCCPKAQLAVQQGKPVCCPDGTVEIGGNCCPPGALGCCDTPCADKQICVSGKCVPV